MSIGFKANGRTPLILLNGFIRASVNTLERKAQQIINHLLPCELRGRLEIIITVNMDEPSKFSITLLLNSTHRIRGLDMRGSHHNKCSDQSRWDGEMHKHSWRDDCPGGHAYTPSDINVKDIGDVFKQFCHECNISFEGNVNPLPIQTRFTGV